MTTPVEDPEDVPNTEPPMAGKYTDYIDYVTDVNESGEDPE